MKSKLIPKTLSELEAFLEQHELEGMITKFHIKSTGGLVEFGFMPTSLTIDLTMVCNDKDAEEQQDIFAEE